MATWMSFGHFDPVGEVGEGVCREIGGASTFELVEHQ
jgi:hypothetical protein